MSDVNEHIGGMSGSRWSRLEPLIKRFDEAWQHGQRPSIQDYLPSDAGERPAVLIELVHVELENRLKAGEAARVEEYLARYPELTSDRDVVLDLIAEEYEVRRKHGSAALDDYFERFPQYRAELATRLQSPPRRRKRFPIRLNCPHCHNPIQIVAEGDEDVICPSCGSSFRLDPDRTTSWSPEKLPRLGKFELLKAVGRGAFGTVYLARDTELDRTVAVKVPRSGRFATEEDEDRFVREARSVARLHDPAIVPVYEVGRSETFPYIVSAYVEGITLADALTGRRFGFSEAAELVVQVAEALEHAHRQGVVHRDLKPSNIMLDAEGKPHLLDFGLARRDEGEVTMTVDGQILGTPAYMSPEQARGEAHRVDGRSDVYSLGVILYELLVGELPFRGNSRMLLHQVLHDDPRPPRKVNDRIPRDLETICLKAMAKEPGRRYQAAQAFAADLRRWLTGVPIQARPVSNAERFWRWCRRNPTVAVLAAAVMLSMLTGTVIASYFASEARTQAREAFAEKTRADEEAKKAIAQKKQADAKAEEARRHLYVSHMHLAHQAWEEGGIDRMQELLARWSSPTAVGDLPGWEFQYLKSLCQKDQVAIRAQDAGVSSLAWAPDGKRLATGNWDGTVKVWDVSTWQPVFTLSGQTGAVRSVAWSPRGERLASAGNDQTVIVWLATTGQKVTILHGHGEMVEAVAWSPDGQRLASGGPDGLKVWNTATGQEVATLRGHKQEVGMSISRIAVTSVAWSPDGQRLASASQDGTVTVWAATWDDEFTFGEETTEVRNIESITWSPDGVRLASAHSDGTARIWDVKSGQEILIFRGHRAGLSSVAWSPDGKRVASTAGSGGETVIRIWDALSGVERVTLRGHTGHVGPIAWSPDGRRLASADGDTVRVWSDPMEQDTVTLHGHSGWVHSVAWSPDGQWLASAGADGEVKLWHKPTWQEARTLSGHTIVAYSLAWSPDGARLASAGDDVRIWEASTGRQLITIDESGLVYRVVWCPDGEWLATLQTYNDEKKSRSEVKIWDAGTGLRIQTINQPKQVNAIAWAPDGKRLASADIDGVINVWDAVTGQVLGTMRDETAWGGLAWSPDGQRLASGSGDSVKVGTSQRARCPSPLFTRIPSPR